MIGGDWIRRILLINGVVDIVPLFIRAMGEVFLKDIFEPVYMKNKKVIDTKQVRTLAEIFTWLNIAHGIMRLYVGYHINSNADVKYLAIMSYIAEALFFINLWQKKMIHPKKGLGPAAICITLALIVYQAK